MRRILTAGAVVLGALIATEAKAVTHLFDATNTSIIPGLTGFATLGSDMDGLEVTVFFAGGGSDTALWADTGASSGAATGTGWSLSLTGDTFAAPWDYSGASITGFRLDGRNALTVFDVTNPSFGTDGSAQGADWACLSGDCNDAIVTYRYIVAIGLDAPVEDLWQVVDVDLGAGEGLTDFSFRQDTDNDSRLRDDPPIPEPGTMLLLGSGLAGLAMRRWRRQH